ncbi:MAG: restriction endonuclease [Pyrinomonadaceae bacterium]
METFVSFFIIAILVAVVGLIAKLYSISENNVRSRQRQESDNRRKELKQYTEDLQRLRDNSEYQFVRSFVAKGDWQADNHGIAGVRTALRNRGWDFTFEQIHLILKAEDRRLTTERTKTRIIARNPSNEFEIIETFLELYRSLGLYSFGPDDSDLISEVEPRIVENDVLMFEVLQEILSSKGYRDASDNDIQGLKDRVFQIEVDVEQMRFEKKLLIGGATGLSVLEIDMFTGYEFETFLTELFQKMGYSVEQTRLSGDQGADVIVTKFGEKTVIQAKRFSGKVGNGAVQEIVAAMRFYGAEAGMVVTNNYFTPSANALAAANDIKLVDRDELSELIRSHW